LTRVVDKYSYNFVQDDVCSYIIHSPSEMKENDILHLKVFNIENAQVYVAKSKGYKWIDHLDYVATENSVFDTRMGWQFYISGVANSVFRGTFSIKVWVEQGAAAPILEPPKDEPEPAAEKEVDIVPEANGGSTS